MADPTPMTDEELAGIKERVNKAKQGPWAWQASEGLNSSNCLQGSVAEEEYPYALVARDEPPVLWELNDVPVIAGQKEILTPEGRDNGTWIELRREDAAFIAHSRTDVPLLIAEIERLKAENTRLLERNI